ncbi:hypothetical protein JCM10207_000358 [Rhodosporidiobolus poonsookiae]
MSISLALPSSSLPSSLRPIQRLEASPLVLATLLDAHLRRTEGQDRVLGTLLGSRNPETGAVEVKNAFAVPYEVRGKGQVTIDMDHHRAMLDLHLKVAPRETVVGWFATSPQLNSFTPLLHSFYTSESAPFAAVHLTVDPATLAFTAYTAAPLGLASSSTASSSAFVPLKATLTVAAHDRAALDLLSTNLSPLSASLDAAVDADVPLPTPLAQLHALLAAVQTNLDRVLAYVRAVVQGEQPGDAKVGRRLLETVGSVPGAKEDKSRAEQTEGEGETAFEEEFNSHLADVLMVSYLSNVIKTQSELAGRLGLLL